MFKNPCIHISLTQANIPVYKWRNAVLWTLALRVAGFRICFFFKVWGSGWLENIAAITFSKACEAHSVKKIKKLIVILFASFLSTLKWHPYGLTQLPTECLIVTYVGVIVWKYIFLWGYSLLNAQSKIGRNGFYLKGVPKGRPALIVPQLLWISYEV